MISLFGYGETNKALSEILAPCNIYDDKFDIKNKDKFNNNLLPSSFFDPKDSNLEIITPGIPPFSKLAKSAKNLISEYDFIYKNPTPFSIWISGTNGKTTTTQMIELLLKNDGGFSGGNIGIPLCKIDKKAKIWILETSSFTLHYTNIAKPNIYVLLPITSDHISWHGSFKNYVNSKLKPLYLMDNKSISIIPSEFKDSIWANNYKGLLYHYNDTYDLAKIFCIDINQLNFKGAFLLDCVLALSVSKIIKDYVDYDLINSFKIGEHRVEEILDSKGRLFINDSKATNIDSTLKAIENYKNKMIYLILGGESKGISLEPLIIELKSFNVNVFAIGSNSKNIFNLCKSYNIKAVESNTLKNAMDYINNILDTNSVCILSPACASLDQFNSYKQRGELFKSYVKNI